MATNCACSCAESGPTLVFACSGAADVGAVTDQAARALSARGLAKMYCLAGIGGRVPLIMENTRTAAAILAIDGCDKACAKATLEQAGFAGFRHVQLGLLGLEKGQSPATHERIELVVNAATTALAAPK